jgi:hypothetical protein
VDGRWNRRSYQCNQDEDLRGDKCIENDQGRETIRQKYYKLGEEANADWADEKIKERTKVQIDDEGYLPTK